MTAGRPSKFTADRKTTILQALEIGASQRTAAYYAGISPATLTNWLARGRDAPESSPWAKFLLAVRQAEAAPNIRALGIVHTAEPDRPELAWKRLERKEPGYAPPQPNALPPAAAPVVIQLSFSHQQPQLVQNEVIEGEVVEDEQNSLPNSATPEPA